jgi:hypothetical protein
MAGGGGRIKDEIKTEINRKSACFPALSKICLITQFNDGIALVLLKGTASAVP